MTDPDSTKPNGDEQRRLHRRRLIKAGAWTVPAIVLVTATPAAASSGDDGLVPFSNLIVTNFGASSRNNNPWPNPGPIGWQAGVRVATGTANVPYALEAVFPDGSTHTVASGTLLTVGSNSVNIPNPDFGGNPTPIGTYTLTLLLTGSDKTDVAAGPLTVIVNARN